MDQETTPIQSSLVGTMASHDQPQGHPGVSDIQTDQEPQVLDRIQPNCQQQSPSQHEEQQLQPVRIQVDMSSFVGRIKQKPICKDETLREEAMTTEQLSQMTFTFIETSPPAPTNNHSHQQQQPTQTASSGTSSAPPASRTIKTVSQHHSNSHNHHHEHSAVVSSGSSTASREWSDHETSERINLKVTTQSVSRNGRQSQRWQADVGSQRMYRLVTGCVPIVEGGKILFASSASKPEWILPKGGWEKDEEMEESAIRETFEEAGVLGILGPRLSEIEYETRKAKKRRLEFEEIKRKAAKQLKDSTPSSIASDVVPPSSESSKSGTFSVKDRADTSAGRPSGEKPSSLLPSPSSSMAQQVPDKILHKIRGHSARSQHSSDVETASVASESSTNTYTHVRMTLIPLYVTDVRGEWPEQGRFRKAVDIDEAIKITESRPEFQAALIEVKEKNLHLPQLNRSSASNSVVTQPSISSDTKIPSFAQGR